MTQRTLSAICFCGLLAACSNGPETINSPPRTADQTPPAATRSYEVSVVNLTQAQPLSPFAVVFSEFQGFRAWRVGQAASPQLELLAEGGDNGELLEVTRSIGSASDNGPLAPGATTVIDADVTESGTVYLTAVSMLVNTNDAFVGITGADISALDTGESATWALPVWDAGTEANSELAGTIPGPADGGEGFNAARDDVDYVARHPGVVTADDGYAESVLTEQHRFNTPVAMLTIRRID
jgi:hypothetical protein